jgi:drug/metabolite transporter (DMT)-like permease
MLPILAGIATALFFATSALSSARASRRAGSAPAVGGVMIVGIFLLGPIVLFVTPLPAGPAVPPESFLWAAVGGAANVGGLLLIYRALRIGAVGIVSTIASTEGALAAVISVLAGQTLAPGSGPALAVIAVGVMLAATGGGHEVEEGVAIDRARSLRAAGFAACAASLFGIGLFTIGHASATLPAAWIVFVGRIVGVLAVALPLFATGRLRLPRASLPYVVLTGCTEVGGYTMYAIGAHDDIALTAVLASMFAPTAAVFAFVLFRERLAPRQIAGIAFVVLGIAILGILTA